MRVKKATKLESNVRVMGSWCVTRTKNPLGGALLKKPRIKG